MDSISKSRLQWRWQEPADQASDQTLPLHLDNLELRFETIDKDALQSEKAKKTYEDIAAAFARRRAPPGPSRGDPLRWDDTFRLESRIGCLLRGDRLRQEIASRLRWAISDNVAQAIALQNTYAELLKTNDSKPADELLRDFLLELMEAIHSHIAQTHVSEDARSGNPQNAIDRAACLAGGALAVFRASVDRSDQSTASESLVPSNRRQRCDRAIEWQ